MDTADTLLCKEEPWNVMRGQHLLEPTFLGIHRTIQLSQRGKLLTNIRPSLLVS